MASLYKNLLAIQKEVDEKIKPENIRQGVAVLGIVGTVEPPTIDTADATVTSNDVVKDKVIYAKGKRIIGNLDISENAIINDNITAFTKFVKNENGNIESFSKYQDGCNEAHFYKDLGKNRVYKNCIVEINLSRNAMVNSLNFNSYRILYGKSAFGYAGLAFKAQGPNGSSYVPNIAISDLQKCIPEGKSAYFNGTKVEGTLKNYFEAGSTITSPYANLGGNGPIYNEENEIYPAKFYTTLYADFQNNSGIIFKANSHYKYKDTFLNVGLDPINIKKGINILGVEGINETKYDDENNVVIRYKKQAYNTTLIDIIAEKLGKSNLYKEHSIQLNDEDILHIKIRNFFTSITVPKADLYITNNIIDDFMQGTTEYYPTSGGEYNILYLNRQINNKSYILALDFKDKDDNVVFTTTVWVTNDELFQNDLSFGGQQLSYNTFSKIVDYDITVDREVG